MDQMIKLAEELGKKLAAQPATRRFLARQNALSGDQDAQKLVEQFQKQAQKIADLEGRGSPVEPTDKNKLSELQSQLAGNATVKEFLAAQVEYVDMMKNINQAIAKQLGPDSPPAGKQAEE